MGLSLGCLKSDSQLDWARANHESHELTSFPKHIDWRLSNNTSKATFNTYTKIITQFLDSNTSPYSIHRIALLGKQFEKEIGEWFGPSTISQVLKYVFFFCLSYLFIPCSVLSCSRLFPYPSFQKFTFLTRLFSALAFRSHTALVLYHSFSLSFLSPPPSPLSFNLSQTQMSDTHAHTLHADPSHAEPSSTTKKTHPYPSTSQPTA